MAIRHGVAAFQSETSVWLRVSTSRTNVSWLLTLKMTTARVAETSVTNESLSEDYNYQDDHKTNKRLLV